MVDTQYEVSQFLNGEDKKQEFKSQPLANWYWSS